MSLAYDSLFSVSASLNSPETYMAAITHVRDMLEQWKLSVPPEMRPGETQSLSQATTGAYKTAILHTHLTYYLVVVGLARLTLHVDQTPGESVEFSKKNLMDTARACIELTRFVDIQPHTPVL